MGPNDWNLVLRGAAGFTNGAGGAQNLVPSNSSIPYLQQTLEADQALGAFGWLRPGNSPNVLSADVASRFTGAQSAAPVPYTSSQLLFGNDPNTAIAISQSASAPTTANGVIPGFSNSGAIATGNLTALNQTASMPWYSSPAVTGNYTPTDDFSWNNVPAGGSGFNNRGPSPTSDPDDAPSPIMLTPQNDRRSVVPDGSAWTSAQGAAPATPAFEQEAAYSPAGNFFGNFPGASAVAPATSLAAFDQSGFNSGPWAAADFNAIAQGIGRLLSFWPWSI